MNEVIELGTVYPSTVKHKSREGRVYDVSGSSPTLLTPTGGGIIPLVKERDERDNQSRAVQCLQVGCDCRPTWDMPLPPGRRNGGGTSIVEFDENTKIRRLTPRECFRLQSFTDDDYEKAAFVNSDNQLYKQMGNSVTCKVIYEIAKRMVESGEKEKEND